MGFCWWLVVSLLLVLCCCCVAVGLLYRRFRQAEEQDDHGEVGEETFDKFAGMEENCDMVLAPSAGKEEMAEVPNSPNFRDMGGGMESLAGSSLEDPLIASVSPPQDQVSV